MSFTLGHIWGIKNTNARTQLQKTGNVQNATALFSKIGTL
jgi:hypothetical protein